MNYEETLNEVRRLSEGATTRKPTVKRTRPGPVRALPVEEAVRVQADADWARAKVRLEGAQPRAWQPEQARMVLRAVRGTWGFWERR